MEVVVNITNILRKLTLGCGFASLCVSAQASANWGDNCCQPVCCPPTICCENGPLSCGAFGVQVKGGVTPSFFSDKGHNTVTNPLLIPPVFTLGRTANFDKFFDTPWQVGAELQWNASTNVQFFAEYVYENAKGRRHTFDVGTLAIAHRYKDLQSNSFYLGARYYFSSIWNSDCGTMSLAPFVGFKGGLVWYHNNNHFNDSLTDLLPVGVIAVSNSKKNNRVAMSAGAQIGADLSINQNWGVVLTVEVVGTEDFGGIKYVTFNPAVTGGITNGTFGDHGKIISVPVTLGVRYTF